MRSDLTREEIICTVRARSPQSMHYFDARAAIAAASAVIGMGLRCITGIAAARAAAGTGRRRVTAA
jgi:hypothetical protein